MPIILALCFALPFVFYGVQVVRRKRQHIAFKLRRAAVAMVFYFGVTGILIERDFPPGEAIAFGFLAGIASGLYFVTAPKRSRYIPKAVRHAVIARDLKGEPFNSKIHHIDHVVPFSKGGDHSLENLRVMLRSKNLAKSDRMPGLRELLYRKSGVGQISKRSMENQD